MQQGRSDTGETPAPNLIRAKLAPILCQSALGEAPAPNLIRAKLAPIGAGSVCRYDTARLFHRSAHGPVTCAGNGIARGKAGNCLFIDFRTVIRSAGETEDDILHLHVRIRAVHF